MVKVPNFFIVGAPKAGTTSLYAYLDQHPQVYMSPVKEPSYFAAELYLETLSEQHLHGDMREKRFGGRSRRTRESPVWFLIGPRSHTWEDYLNLFQNVSGEQAIGEATASYLWSPTAARNIATRIPHARIIINLRNPVDRAYSQYLQMLTAGVIGGSFRELIDASLRCQEDRLTGARMLLEFGRYAGQIERYYREFPRSQIHISYYEDLQRSPRRLMAEMFTFLGVDPGFVPDVSQRHHEPVIPRLNALAYPLKKSGAWRYVRKLAPVPLGPRLRSLLVRSRGSLQMPFADRAFLTDYYRDEVARLATLLNRELSSWLDPGSPP